MNTKLSGEPVLLETPEVRQGNSRFLVVTNFETTNSAATSIAVSASRFLINRRERLVLGRRFDGLR